MTVFKSAYLGVCSRWGTLAPLPKPRLSSGYSEFCVGEAWKRFGDMCIQFVYNKAPGSHAREANRAWIAWSINGKPIPTWPWRRLGLNSRKKMSDLAIGWFCGRRRSDSEERPVQTPSRPASASRCPGPLITGRGALDADHRGSITVAVPLIESVVILHSSTHAVRCRSTRGCTAGNTL